jgi:hypothetical protein
VAVHHWHSVTLRHFRLAACRFNLLAAGSRAPSQCLPQSLELHAPLGLQRSDYSRDLQLAKWGLAKWGSEVSLHGSNPEPMSALYQKATSYPPHGARAAIPERPTVAAVAGRWLLLPGAPMK